MNSNFMWIRVRKFAVEYWCKDSIEIKNFFFLICAATTFSSYYIDSASNFDGEQTEEVSLKFESLPDSSYSVCLPEIHHVANYLHELPVERDHHDQDLSFSQGLFPYYLLYFIVDNKKKVVIALGGLRYNVFPFPLKNI